MPWASASLSGRGFSLTGLAAADHTGPAITNSFVVAAVGCVFAGLCYAGFASMLPVAGSAYTYSYATMGEFIAWFIGWNLVLEYAVGAATVSISWSRYLAKFFDGFDVHLPAALTPGPWVGGVMNLPAIFIVVLMSLLLMKGTKESATVNAVIVALKIAVVLVFIVLGWKTSTTKIITPLFRSTRVSSEPLGSAESSVRRPFFFRVHWF